MSPEQKRKFNTAFGSFFLASGLVAWAMAGYFAVTPNDPRPAPVYVDNVVDLQSCARTLRTLGFPEVSVQKDDVIAHEALSANPKEQLERATLASSVCKLEMKSFCMGEACPQPGVTIVATKPEIMREAKKKAQSIAKSANAASAPSARKRPPAKGSSASAENNT